MLKIIAGMLNTRCLLLHIDGFELSSFISVYSTASRTALIEVLLDMVPTKTTNLFPVFRV